VIELRIIKPNIRTLPLHRAICP